MAQYSLDAEALPLFGNTPPPYSQYDKHTSLRPDLAVVTSLVRSLRLSDGDYCYLQHFLHAPAPDRDLWLESESSEGRGLELNHCFNRKNICLVAGLTVMLFVPLLVVMVEVFVTQSPEATLVADSSTKFVNDAGQNTTG
jgi:hypothetical protein